jgi:hypothetical protein
MKTVRVKIPTNATELLKLIAQIQMEHVALGVNLPLGKLDWTTIDPKITQATGYDNQATEHHQKGEQLTEKRDVLMPDVREFVRSCRDVLLGLNRSNPRALADFHFVVNDAVPSKKKLGTAMADRTNQR